MFGNVGANGGETQRLLGVGGGDGPVGDGACAQRERVGEGKRGGGRERERDRERIGEKRK